MGTPLPAGSAFSFAVGTGPLLVGRTAWREAATGATWGLELGVLAEGPRREGGGPPGRRDPRTAFHWEGSCESSTTTNRLIHNLWSQRKSLVLIIIIRDND